jgi:glycerophosphoryl diester phosphodiesterase
LGDLARIDVDFLSISAANATSRLVRDLRRRGRDLHVWTVDDPQNALMLRNLIVGLERPEPGGL